MCFSAEASFAGAAVITAAGVGALALVEERRQVPFAALPLLFGIHQALEGWTWLELDGRTEAALSGVGVHSWVMFAWALLPIYVPWAVWLMEDDPRRRRWMAGLMAVGGALAVFMFVQAVQPEVSVRVVADNLDYRLGVGFSAVYLAVPYVAATCLTPALSTRGWVRAFGIANFLAMGTAAIIEAKDYSSIWCTLAAFLSLMILGHFLAQRRAAGTRAGGAGARVAGA
ncbi:hypothetical protein PO878_21205 [Iamia majanohamensis]|uniref:Uncharacterized protein n=1 Tax=Iamia majanohamensis TaxID=467976 RepID=A0AAF0BW48_9ACTN|nr:DUF6629 family protein [Iamia majanohamensis]WCO67014.1 hypothetical protein PO878_21205 [Iamia majanohamensis]